MDQSTDLLYGILEIIEYKGDRKNFINKFKLEVQLTAFLNLINSKQESDRENLIKSFSQINGNYDQISEILKSNFTEQQLYDATYKVSFEMMNQYLDFIDSTLDETQKMKLNALIQKNSSQISY